MLNGYVCDVDICEKSECYEKKENLMKKRKGERPIKKEDEGVVKRQY